MLYTKHCFFIVFIIYTIFLSHNFYLPPFIALFTIAAVASWGLHPCDNLGGWPAFEGRIVREGYIKGVQWWNAEEVICEEVLLVANRGLIGVEKKRAPYMQAKGFNILNRVYILWMARNSGGRFARACLLAITRVSDRHLKGESTFSHQQTTPYYSRSIKPPLSLN